MKTTIFLLFCLAISNISMSQSILGSNCIDELDTNYPYAITASSGNYYLWTIDGTAPGYFPANNLSAYETYQNTVAIRFENIGTATITCLVYNRYYENNVLHMDYTGQATFSLSVKRKIGELWGPRLITNPGFNTYYIDPIPEATSYSWTLPSGWTGSSTSNSITARATGIASSGNVTVQVNGALLCTSTKSLSVTISKCYGHIGSYSSSNISNRVVSGDFDRDGKEDDIATFYNYGNNQTTIHVWKSNGSAFTYQGDNGWWTSNTYNADKLIGVVSGDFNRDGFKDDIAAFYNYDNSVTELHVWTSNGSSFTFSSRWSANDYDATKIANRVVSGDFDRDGFVDDIAAFYNYGNFLMRVHVWQSTGNGMTGPSSNGWYSNSTYDANKISDRVVSGDFDRDGFSDDIAAFYDYSNNNTSIHVWQSTGSSFSGPSSNGWYYNSTYDANKISDRVVSGDFDRDGFKDDIVAFYDYSNSNTQAHVWQSTGSSFTGPTNNGWWQSNDYDATKITARVVSANFNNDNYFNEIAAFYSYSGSSTSIHIWTTNSSSLLFSGDNFGWWGVCNSNEMDRSMEIENTENDENVIYKINSDIFKVFPNPSDGMFNIKLYEDDCLITICDFSGKKVYSVKTDVKGEYNFDLSNFAKGIYFISVQNAENNSSKKMIIQ